MKQSHEHGVCHGEMNPKIQNAQLQGFYFSFHLFFLVNEFTAGDIKCENVLVTSWNWLYLADFASFKPTYIPHDDPSDFSFFFDTGERRRCYVAPEVCFAVILFLESFLVMC